METYSKKCPFFWVDAFTQRPFGGNPCVVLRLSQPLQAHSMLKIAKEFGLSETAFVTTSSDADFEARYFTPEREIPLAGHPTLAVAQSLLELGEITRKPEPYFITLKLPAGVIRVEIATHGEKTTFTMEQKKPEFFESFSISEIAPIFGLVQEDFLPIIYRKL